MHITLLFLVEKCKIKIKNEEEKSVVVEKTINGKGEGKWKLSFYSCLLWFSKIFCKKISVKGYYKLNNEFA